ncbi:hypothetical protein J437_LFUL004820 [Ladona fulva]|uniref:Uncharacterized protein n=1 Tax=Ladona fulva TaxID=123851 RepID=A0A8K0NYJ8_LADFU|nr:hypothetical protein J437_LFUL004820 [Ladona fulva]
MACGNFISCFPEECRGSMPSLYPLFFRNLGDTIQSVRQGGAAALGSCARVYGKEAANMMLGRVIEGLNELKNQPSDSEKYGGNGETEAGRTSPLPFGVAAKRLRDNDLDLHTDQQMYSCGSLAPKMGRGGGSDHKFHKPSQPWELADGCVHLVAELCQIPWMVNTLPSNLNMSSAESGQLNIITAINSIAEACHWKHYAQHLTFLETVCKQLPAIGRGIGKKAFKSIIHDFFDAIFYSLESENALTSSAASQCLNQIGTFLGPNILRARVEQHNPNYICHLDANVFIAPL